MGTLHVWRAPAFQFRVANKNMKAGNLLAVAMVIVFLATALGAVEHRQCAPGDASCAAQSKPPAPPEAKPPGPPNPPVTGGDGAAEGEEGEEGEDDMDGDDMEGEDMDWDSLVSMVGDLAGEAN